MYAHFPEFLLKAGGLSYARFLVSQNLIMNLNPIDVMMQTNKFSTFDGISDIVEFHTSAEASRLFLLELVGAGL